MTPPPLPPTSLQAMIICMEFCDSGNLSDAIRNGCFKQVGWVGSGSRGPGGAGAGAMGVEGGGWRVGGPGGGCFMQAGDRRARLCGGAWGVVRRGQGGEG